MPKIKDTEIKNYAIFIFIEEENKNFFIGKSPENNMRTVFSNHYYLKNKKTKKMFEKGKNNNKLPQTYLLEKINLTKNTACGEQIIWTKYFMEHGFNPVDKIVAAKTEDLNIGQKIRFEQINEINIDTLLTEEHQLFKNYKQIRKRNIPKEKYQINFVVTPEDYEIITYSAKQKNRTVAAYCREMALNQHILNFDYPSIKKHTKEITELRETINNIVYSIMNSGECYQIDVDNILNLAKEIYQSERKFLSQMAKDREKKSQELKKYLLEKE